MRVFSIDCQLFSAHSICPNCSLLAKLPAVQKRLKRGNQPSGRGTTFNSFSRPQLLTELRATKQHLTDTWTELKQMKKLLESASAEHQPLQIFSDPNQLINELWQMVSHNAAMFESSPLLLTVFNVISKLHSANNHKYHQIFKKSDDVAEDICKAGESSAAETCFFNAAMQRQLNS